MIRYVIRPPGILTTPKRLRSCLGALRTVNPSVSRRLLSWSKDFFLSYPPPEQIREFSNALSLQRLRSPESQQTLDSYQRVRAFYKSTKPVQRTTLANLGFPVPRAYRSRAELHSFGDNGSKLISRPLRHYGGNGFGVLTYDQASIEDSWNPSEEYLQELYPKSHEYRVMIVRGHPIITLLKRVPEDTPVDLPWNHSQGSSFVTVTDPNLNRLRHTDVYSVIDRSFDFFQSIDLCGLDVMFRRSDQSYRVCELNLCPSLVIEDNLRKVSEYVLSNPRQLCA